MLLYLENEKKIKMIIVDYKLVNPGSEKNQSIPWQ